MAVLVNYKICDNAKECGGIAVCPTGALSWDEENETIKIENDKCISCGMCEKECPIGAIVVASDDDEYNKLKKEIDDDPRTTKDLFVDRYGAAAISEFFQINLNEIDEKVKKDCYTFVEINSPDTIECLLKSIPVKDLTKSFPSDTLYFKVETEEEVSKYNINTLPALLVFKDGNLLKTINGYYTVDDKDSVIQALESLIK